MNDKIGDFNMSNKFALLETMRLMNSSSFNDESEAEKIISYATQKALLDGMYQREIDEIIDYVMNDMEPEFKTMSTLEKAKEIKNKIEQYMLEYSVVKDEEQEDEEVEEDKIKLVDSKKIEPLEEKGAIAPAGMGALAGRDDLSKKIVAKLMSISKALADEFGFDQKVVLQDMINDLRLAGGEEITDIIKGDSPIEQMTTEMATTFKELGLDSNIALHALLQMDEKKNVEMFRQFLNQGGQLPNFEKGTKISQKELEKGASEPQKGMKFLESFRDRVLNESIEDIYTKFYSDIKRDVFDMLIKLDPTFREDEDKLGTYGKWILKGYKQKQLKERDLERVNEILFDFNERKRFITEPGGKDIFKYKTLDEIRSALDSIQLTANQVAKQARKAKQHADLGEEAEFIGESDKWEIWSPKTYAASCKLGSGTTWCTASTSYRGYFDNYTSSGKLYIFYPKDGDMTKKWQAHVNKSNEVTTFMDANDRPTKEFSTFIFEEKLLPTLKASELKNVDAILDVENMERVNRGEPFIYAGSKIKKAFIPLIKIIHFAKDLKIEKIPSFTFKGCSNMEEIYVPLTITDFGLGCFEGCDKVKIYTPKREGRIGAYKRDIEFLEKRVVIIDEKDMPVVND
jgi:hypothetical protein